MAILAPLGHRGLSNEHQQGVLIASHTRTPGCPCHIRLDLWARRSRVHLMRLSLGSTGGESVMSEMGAVIT